MKYQYRLDGRWCVFNDSRFVLDASGSSEGNNELQISWIDIFCTSCGKPEVIHRAQYKHVMESHYPTIRATTSILTQRNVMSMGDENSDHVAGGKWPLNSSQSVLPSASHRDEPTRGDSNLLVEMEKLVSRGEYIVLCNNAAHALTFITFFTVLRLPCPLPKSQFDVGL